MLFLKKYIAVGFTDMLLHTRKCLSCAFLQHEGIRYVNCYRPHPKDDGRLYFHFVCQSTPGGGGVPGLSKGKNF